MPAERPVFNLVNELKNHSKEEDTLKWEGGFSEYVEKVVENPNIVRSAHKYVYDAVTSRPDFFTTGSNALFGAEKPVGKFTDLLKGGAQGLEVRKRIALLIGPPGSGKSTLVNGTKRGLEEYSKTPEGEIYAIKDCPMQEEPLHLIPKDVRPLFEQKTGIHIEGELCPHCNAKYKDKSLKDLLSDKGEGGLKVKRMFFSEKDRVGIGTFKPSDPKSQDMTELVGSVDLSKLGEHGVASDPRAFRFDGELNVANRGVMEFVEMLKSDERFLYVLLDLTQDRVIKAPRFPNISADEVILAHTNMTEYKSYTGNPKNEALKDRMYVIEVPYNLKVSEEEKIYEKLIGESEIIRKSQVHINPMTLEMASSFAVLSRMGESAKANVTRVKKMKLYNGEETGDMSQRDLKELQAEVPGEGMSGISPRYVIDSLSTALIQGDKKCLTPMDALRALRDNMENHPHTRDLKPDEKQKIRNIIDNEVRGIYNEKAKKEVQSAFVHSYEDNARSLAENYLFNVVAFNAETKIVDPITDEESAPDEQLMRSIEEQISISEPGKKAHRQQLANNILQKQLRGQEFDYTQYPRLREAIESKLMSSMKDVVKLTINPQFPNEGQQRRVSGIQERLKEEKGYCDHCSSDLIRHVGTLLPK